MIFLFIIPIFILLCLGQCRYFIFHLPQLLPLIIQDLIEFIKTPRQFRKFGVVMYCGYMGEGKTIKAVDDVLYYKRLYPDLNIYSNIHIACDYTVLENWQQLESAPPNTIFLVDEVSTLLHSRNWKDFPTDMCRMLFQSRKNHKYLIMTAQRFHHVDKTVRDITSKVYQQYHDIWRIHHSTVFDAWEMENCTNINELVPLARFWWHRTNKMYRQYNTDELVSNLKAEDFISNNEIIERQGTISNNLSDMSKNKKYKKFLKRG